MPNLFRHLTCIVYTIYVEMSHGVLKQVQHDLSIIFEGALHDDNLSGLPLHQIKLLLINFLAQKVFM